MRRLVGHVVLALIPLCLVSQPVLAVPGESFLGSSVTLQATRLPTADELRCANVACSPGLFPEPMLTGVEYRTDRLIGGGAFASDSGYQGKLSAFWTSAPTIQSTSDAAFLSINLVSFATTGDARTAIRNDAALEGIDLQPSASANSVDRWTATLNAPDGSRVNYVYLLTRSPAPSVIRSVCALTGSTRRSPWCGPSSLLRISMDLALRAPQAEPPEPIERESMTQLPTTLRQVFSTVSPGSAPWLADTPDDVLLEALADTTTLSSQYEPSGQPALALFLRSVQITGSSGTQAFVSQGCARPLPGTSCRLVPWGTEGTVMHVGLKSRPRQVLMMQMRVFANGRLATLTCTRPRGYSALTAIQQRTCIDAGAALTRASAA